MKEIERIRWLSRGALSAIGICWDVGWVILVFAILANNLPITSSTNTGATTKPSAAQQVGPTHTVTPTLITPSSSQATSPRVIARYNDYGTQNTQSFKVIGSWILSWAYRECTGTGEFIVKEYNTDGSKDPNGITLNAPPVATKVWSGPFAAYAHEDSGSHYFSVDSGCSWSLAVVIGGS